MKNTEATESISWDAVHAHPDFTRLVMRRRTVTWRLFAISMVFFFSVPVISTYFPQVFRAQIWGSINVGVLYLVAQYFGGGVIAWRYAVQLKLIDALSTQLVQSLTPKTSNA